MHETAERRHEVVGLVISGVLSGLAQLYNRQPVKVAVFVAVGLVLSWLTGRAVPTELQALTRLGAALLAPLLALLAVSLWSVIDAWRAAGR